MGSKTQYLSKALLDHTLGGVALFTRPDNVWFVLSSAAFDGTATGGSCNELTNSDYDRIEMPNDNSTWSAASNGLPSMKTNLDDIVWATATADWPQPPASIYVADASSGGNLLYGADFSSVDPVAAGDTFKVLAGTFLFAED